MSDEKARYQFTANVNWPAERILEAIQSLETRTEQVEKSLVKITTVLVGFEGTDSKGLVGDVHHTFKVCDSHEERLSKVEARCDMEHGKDPGAKKDSKGLTVWQFIMDNKKVFWPVLVGIFAMGVFAAGIIIELIKKYVALGATP